MTEKQVLEETIAKWNDSVNDISKFKFNSKEVDLFCGMLKRFGEMKVSQALNLTDVVERFALIQWINGQPLIDGSDSFNTKEDALKHWQTLPKIDNVIYTVCRIRNVL